MVDTRPLASRRDIANYLGVPEGTLTQWAHRGIGPEYRRVGRHAKYRWSDVERWLSEQAVHGGGNAA